MKYVKCKAEGERIRQGTGKKRTRREKRALFVTLVAKTAARERGRHLTLRDKGNAGNNSGEEKKMCPKRGQLGVLGLFE